MMEVVEAADNLHPGSVSCQHAFPFDSARKDSDEKEEEEVIEAAELLHVHLESVQPANWGYLTYLHLLLI